VKGKGAYVLQDGQPASCRKHKLAQQPLVHKHVHAPQYIQGTADYHVDVEYSPAGHRVLLEARLQRQRHSLLRQGQLRQAVTGEVTAQARQAQQRLAKAQIGMRQICDFRSFCTSNEVALPQCLTCAKTCI
jgi:hypothetical protein